MHNLSSINMQQNIEDSERDAIFERLRANPDNNKCFDCDKKNPKWSSVYLGIYLCLDCAGKHREYGPQISFARSLNLDTWNRRYITFMEHGGNTKALEYFKKQGLKAPYDYKNPAIQKYKQELTKKVDAALGSNIPKEEIKPAAVKAEEEKPKRVTDNVQAHSLTVKSFSDKPTHGETSSKDDPFANNIIINKGETKTKGFTVEFSKNKSGFASNKGRIAAKKIDNIDLDSLSLNEDSSAIKKANAFDMMGDSAFGVSGKSNVKEIYAKTNEPYSAGVTSTEKLKQFSNAKAISSDSFNQNYSQADASKVKQFRNANAISSAQYFGGHEEETEDDWNEVGDNVREFMGKLKDKAGVFVNKMKEEWEA